MIEKPVSFCIETIFCLHNKWQQKTCAEPPDTFLTFSSLFLTVEQSSASNWSVPPQKCSSLDHSNYLQASTAWQDFGVEFGGQIYFRNKSLAVVRTLHQPGKPSTFALSKQSFAPRAPPSPVWFNAPPTAWCFGQCTQVSRCKMILEMLLPRLQVLKSIGKFGSTLCCFGARSVR